MVDGNMIYEARKSKGWTQAELGNKIGVSQATIANLENGRTDPENYLEQLQTALAGLGAFGPEEVDAIIEAEPSSFGEWLRTKREASRLSVTELAERAAVTPPTVYNIESGKSRNPQKTTRDKLARALGQTVPEQVVREAETEQAIVGLGSLTDFDPLQQSDWPQCAGVYVLYDVSQRPIYVGKAGNIANRLGEHSQKFWFRSPIVENAAFIEVTDRSLRHQLEQVLIKFLKSNAVINRQSTESYDREE